MEIEQRLMKPLVLHMPNKTGRFHLHSDTSRFATGSTLYQIQGGKPKLTAYASKRLPEAAKNYSITELEPCGLAINIASFAHLLKRVDFDAIVDHLALTHIIKSKPATTSQNKWHQTLGSTRSKEGVRSKPEARKTTHHAQKGVTEKLCIGQGRAGLRRKPEPDCINQPSDVTRRISERSKIVTGKTNSPQHTNSVHDRGVNNDKSFPPDGLFHPDPLCKPLPKQQNAVSPINQNTSINLDIKENSPFQEGIISETIQRLDKSFFQNPKRLEDFIDMGDLIHKFLPKQTNINKILHIIQRKVLKGTHLPVEIKEIQAGYLHSPYFREIYQYLSQNKLPHSKLAIKKLEALSEKYVLLDSLLFGIYPEKETAVLAIQEACTDKIITLYHKSLFAGHQGVIKTYLTISDKFFIPNQIHYLRSYIKGCHICQLSRNEKSPTRHFQTRINPNYIPMSRLSMDLKVMSKSQKGHGYILCVIDEVTNFLMMEPIFQARSEEVGEALLEHVITKHCIPDYIIMDQDSAFMSSLMTYLFHILNIKIKTIAPYNHQSLQAEHGIKSLTCILTKHLTGLG